MTKIWFLPSGVPMKVATHSTGRVLQIRGCGNWKKRALGILEPTYIRTVSLSNFSDLSKPCIRTR